MKVIQERILTPHTKLELSPEVYQMSKEQLQELIDKMNQINNKVDDQFRKYGWDIG
jgi:hypothetical protein